LYQRICQPNGDFVGNADTPRPLADSFIEIYEPAVNQRRYKISLTGQHVAKVFRP